MSFGLAPFRIWSTVSNSSGFDRWLMSPVCRRNSGSTDSALILSTAAFNVPTTSVLAGLLNPMWLSLICAKLSSPAISLEPNSGKRLSAYERSTPPRMTQKAPVPAQAMHFRKPRRSTPSWLWSYTSWFWLFSEWASWDVVFRDMVLLRFWTHGGPVLFFVALARQLSWRAARVRESREPAPRMGRVSFVQTARAGRLFPIGLLTN